MSLIDRLRERLDPSKLSGRDRRALVLGVVVLGPALAYGAVVRPYRAALADLHGQIEIERGLLEREEALIASAEVLPEIMYAAQTRAAKTTTRLLGAGNRVLAEAELTDYLQQVAGVSRVLLQQVRALSDTTWRGSPELMPVRIAIQGESDLQGVATYMHRLESSPLLLRVAEVMINPIEPTQPQQRGGNDDDDDEPTGPLPQQADVIQFTALIEAFASTGTNPAF